MYFNYFLYILHFVVFENLTFFLNQIALDIILLPIQKPIIEFFFSFYHGKLY